MRLFFTRRARELTRNRGCVRRNRFLSLLSFSTCVFITRYSSSSEVQWFLTLFFCLEEMGKGWRTRWNKSDDSCPIELPRGCWGGKLDPECYTCFKIETRISFSRIIIKEEFSNLFKQQIRKIGRRRRKDTCTAFVEFLLFEFFLGWDRASTFFLINRDESFEGTM